MSKISLNYETYKNTSEASYEFKNNLQTHTDSMTTTNELLTLNWYGQRAETVTTGFKNDVTSGNYQKANALAKAIDEVLDNFHPKVKTLMLERETVASCLNGSSSSAEAVATEPDLIFDYSKTESVLSNADSVVENGLKMAEILQEMIDAAKALVDGEIDFTTWKRTLAVE